MPLSQRLQLDDKWTIALASSDPALNGEGIMMFTNLIFKVI